MVTFAPPAGCDVSPLRDPTRRSGYRHVYWTGKGGRWAAKVRRCRRLIHIGAAATPAAAARLVAGWFAARYGPDWPRVARLQAGRPPWDIWYARRLGVYRLEVWDRGRPVALAPPGAVGFSTRASAAAYLRRWVYRELGLFAPLGLWRS